MSYVMNIWDPDQELIIKNKGLIDLNNLYKTIYAWFDSRKYEWHEPTFKDKHRDTGLEQEMKIRAFRNDSDFFRMHIDIFLHTWDMVDVEVVKNSKKRMMSRGRFKVTIRASFECDYRNRWEGSKFARALRHFYINYIILRRFLVYGDKMEYEVHGLHEIIKQQLGMTAKGNQFADMW